jgi:hypothetical protein
MIVAVWTQLIPSADLPLVRIPNPRIRNGDSIEWFFEADARSAVTRGKGMDARVEYEMRLAPDVSEGRKRHADAGEPLSELPEVILGTADRPWWPDERAILEAAAVNILAAHNFPVEENFGMVRWATKGIDVYWAIGPASAEEDGYQSAGAIGWEVFVWSDQWPAGSAFNWAWQIFYSRWATEQQRKFAKMGSDRVDGGIDGAWAAGFALGAFLGAAHGFARYQAMVERGGPNEPKWVGPALKVGRTSRGKTPWISQPELAKKIKAEVANTPSEGRIIDKIKEWEKAWRADNSQGLTPSTRNPTPKTGGHN